MSTFDRIERRMPELMSELAPAAVPDYFDDMLRQTGRARQRPAWASPERWLPMDVVARPTSFRAPALRPLLILLLIGLLVAAALVAYAGSQRSKLPAPFGPARNGAIVLGTPDEDIVLFDPLTGVTTTLIGGATRDAFPTFSRDGSKFAFVRLTGNQVGSSWVANADGSDAHEIAEAPVDWLEWSDAGDRVVVSRPIGGDTQVSVADLTTGTSTLLDVGVRIEDPFWRPGHDQLVFKTSNGDQIAYYIVDADGSNAHVIDGVSPFAINDPQLSPDGSLLTYASWENGRANAQGRIHVLDIDAGSDRLLTFDGSDGTVELGPRFSPDGTTLVFERYDASSEGYRLVVASIDGSGAAREIGPVHTSGSGGANVQFSPDGTQVLAVYNDDGAAWLLDVEGDGEQQLRWSSSTPTWQRLAP